MTEDELRPFLRGLSGSKIAASTLGLVFIGTAVVVALYADDPTYTDASNLVLKILVGGFIGTVGGLMLWLAFRNPRKVPAITALTRRGYDIVWIQPTRIITNGQHTTTVYGLHMIDGKEHRLPVRVADEALAAEILIRNFPKVRFGHDEAWAKAYAANPASLRD